MKEIYEKLPDALLHWSDENKRELPWRQDQEPYHIWLSEIMLQQTRVEAVRGYYARFLQALPTVADLANCQDDKLHKLWEGLGYYSRVRNLKKAARVIMEQHGGIFPGEYEKILALPGIGEYTAGAVCSIAFNCKKAAVDGNVLRVVSRLTNDPTPIDLPAYKKQVQKSLEEIYPYRAGDFTQALMELGATVCGPNRKPACDLCPCKAFCLALENGTQEQLPVKLPKKGRRREEMTVFILHCDGKYALRKRDNKGLLADLWEFPHVDGRLDAQAALAKVEEMGIKPADIKRQVEKKHIFTHIEWDMCGIYIDVKNYGGELSWFTAEEIRANAALPTAFRQFWEEIKQWGTEPR